MNGFDKQDRLLFKLPINNFGLVPSILVIPDRRVEPGKVLEIFNPLSDFPLDYPIHRLCYEFGFRTDKGDHVRSETSVHPIIYEQKASLILPFAGTCLVTEGHDLLTHHQRNFPFTHPLIQQIGITGNNSRFAYDFVLVDDNLKMFKNDPQRNEDFFCWGKPVLCPGDGRIVRVVADSPDNPLNEAPPFDVEAHIKYPEKSMERHLGNYVTLDNCNDEFSVLAHMRGGSVHVSSGDEVIKEELMGEIGNSGDSLVPHIHYQLQNGVDLRRSEGLPSRFQRFDLILGGKTRRAEDLCPNTGMIIKHE